MEVRGDREYGGRRVGEGLEVATCFVQNLKGSQKSSKTLGWLSSKQRRGRAGEWDEGMGVDDEERHFLLLLI